MEMFSSLGGACISISIKYATLKPQIYNTFQFKHNVKDDQIIRKKRQISHVLVVKLTLHGLTSWHRRSYTKMCFVIAFIVHRVILSKKVLFSLTTHNSSCGVRNPYLASAQRLYPNPYERQCSSNCWTSVEALYRDVRHIEYFQYF
jgi:hypothetical protein